MPNHRYSTGSETFISFTLTSMEFRKSHDFLCGFCEELAWILREINASCAKFCDFFSSSVKSMRETAQL